MNELKSNDVLLRGLRVHYKEIGSGPALVLVHGFLVNHREWLPVLPYLAPHFRCIVPDLPGFGASEKREPSAYPYTREAFAETVADLMSALSLTKAHVAGHSMGGGIALTLTADRPELVGKLCVVDSMCFPFDLSLKAKLPFLPVLGSLIFKKIYGRSLFHDYFKNDVWSGHAGVDMKTVDEYYDDFNPPDAREAAFAALQITQELASLGPKIARIKKNTLVIWGDDDRIIPLGLGQRLAREIPGARLRVVDKSGHAPNEEHPAEVAAMMLEHFQG